MAVSPKSASDFIRLRRLRHVDDRGSRYVSERLNHALQPIVVGDSRRQPILWFGSDEHGVDDLDRAGIAKECYKGIDRFLCHRRGEQQRGELSVSFTRGLS